MFPNMPSYGPSASTLDRAEYSSAAMRVGPAPRGRSGLGQGKSSMPGYALRKTIRSGGPPQSSG